MPMNRRLRHGRDKSDTSGAPDQLGQTPPQQPPPPAAAQPTGSLFDRPELVTAIVESNFTVSSCPTGHDAAEADSLIGRVTSKVTSQVRHRNS